MFTKEFIAICKNYAQKSNHVLGEEIEDTKKVCKYRISFYSYRLEFRYVKKETVYFKPSSLYCVIYLNKNSVVYYHLTDIIPFLERKTFQSCYFWYIESPEKLNSCFESLVATLENITSQLSFSLPEETTLSDSLFNSYKTIYSLKDRDIDFSKIENSKEHTQSYFLSLQNMRDGYLFSRYCSFAPYALLLKHKVDKALEKYKKLNQKGKLFEYEKCLINHISTSENREFNAFDPSCDPSKADKLMTPLSGLMGFVIVFAIASIFFCGSFAIYNLIISANTLVVLAAPWYMGFSCAGLCSIFGAIILAANVPMPNKHLTKKEAKDLLNISVSKGLKKFSIIIFALSVAASIFFAIMIMTANVRFYDERIEFESKTYNYNEIHSVYYISARYNVYGDRIDRGSYVILFDDNTSLDLDGYTSVELTESDVLPLLKDKGFHVTFADSERELPWYTVEL